jgi:hypothetical protein
VVRGTLYRALGKRTSYELVLPCRAESDRELSVHLEGTSRVPSGVLEGELEARFEGTGQGGVLISGTLPAVRLRFPEKDLSTLLRVDRAARAFVDDVGLEHLEMTAGGLLVSALRPESPAEQGGIAVGDVITRMDDMPIMRPSDMALAESATEATLRVRRGGIEHTLRLERRATRRAQRPQLPTPFAFALALCCAAFFPVRAPDLARLPRDRGSMVGMLSALAGTLPVLLGVVPLAWGLSLPVAAHLGVLMLERSRRREHAATVLLAIASVASVTLSLSAIVLSSDTGAPLRDLRAGALLGSPLLCAPPAWLAWVVLCDHLPWPAHGDSRATRITKAWLVGTVTLTAIGFGLQRPTEGVLAASALLVAQSLAAGVLLAWGRSSARGRFTRPFAVLAPIAASGWSAIEGRGWLEPGLAAFALGIACATALRYAWSVVRKARGFERDPELEPFR